MGIGSDPRRLADLLALPGPYLVHRGVPLERLTTNNEIAGFDRPFSGAIRVAPAALPAVLADFKPTASRPNRSH
ncbi:MAG TPA: hypothetical protein VGG11_14930 [Xanthobacteraceae bacterium]